MVYVLLSIRYPFEWVTNASVLTLWVNILACVCVCREFQSPVMALAAVERLLVIGVGNRVESHRWTGQHATHHTGKASKHAYLPHRSNVPDLKQELVPAKIHPSDTHNCGFVRPLQQTKGAVRGLLCLTSAWWERTTRRGQ